MAHVINRLDNEILVWKKTEYPANRVDSRRRVGCCSAGITEISGRKQIKMAYVIKWLGYGDFAIVKRKNIPQIKQISAERKNIKFAKSAGRKNKDGTCNQLARLQRFSYGKR